MDDTMLSTARVQSDMDFLAAFIWRTLLLAGCWSRVFYPKSRAGLVMAQLWRARRLEKR